MNTLPHLKQFAKVWTLLDQPTRKSEWTVDEKVAAAKAAGFDGIHGQMTDEWSAACEHHGLIKWGEFDLPTPGAAEARIAAEVANGARRISVQVGDHDTPTSEALKLALALQAASKKHGVHAAIEVHRDTCTETPEKVNALIDAYHGATGERLPVNYDLSHPMLIKHLMPWNYSERLFDRPEMIQASQMFHLRPSTGHHCQIPVTDGKGALIEEFLDWIAFVEELFTLWLEGPRPVDELYVCPELGPLSKDYGNYGLSTFPNPWEDAIVCRSEIEKAWQRALARG